MATYQIKVVIGENAYEVSISQESPNSAGEEKVARLLLELSAYRSINRHRWADRKRKRVEDWLNDICDELEARLAEAVELAVELSPGHVVLGGVAAGDGAPADPDRLADVVEGGGFEALGHEEIEGGLLDLRALVGIRRNPSTGSVAPKGKRVAGSGEPLSFWP